MRHFIVKRSFYQDTLGTNIGKVEKKAAFSYSTEDEDDAAAAAAADGTSTADDTSTAAAAAAAAAPEAEAPEKTIGDAASKLGLRKSASGGAAQQARMAMIVQVRRPSLCCLVLFCFLCCVFCLVLSCLVVSCLVLCINLSIRIIINLRIQRYNNVSHYFIINDL
eukprot:COSAG06_NODE_1693_length_8701_cov_80.626133_6_plen_165_part_00